MVGKLNGLDWLVQACSEVRFDWRGEIVMIKAKQQLIEQLIHLNSVGCDISDFIIYVNDDLFKRENTCYYFYNQPIKMTYTDKIAQDTFVIVPANYNFKDKYCPTCGHKLTDRLG